MSLHNDENSRIRIGDLKPGDIALLRDISESAAEKAVHKMFMLMGLDVSNPIDAQRDFNFLRDIASRAHDPEFVEDLGWVRRTRRMQQGIIGKALLTAVGVAVIGSLHAAWIGLQHILMPKP